MKRGDKVTVKSGQYAGESGTVIMLPIGKGKTIVVRRANGYGFTCLMDEVEIKEGATCNTVSA